MYDYSYDSDSAECPKKFIRISILTYYAMECDSIS